VRALLAGAAAVRALRPGARGTVLASFSLASYLDLPGGLVAVVGPDVHRGPLHVVLDGQVAGMASGAPVVVRERALAVGQQHVDLRGLRPWSGVLPPPALVRAAAPLLCTVLEEAAAGSSLLGMGGRARDGLERLRAGDLEGAAALLGGLGPGLTPAGDDVLAGGMFALRAASGPAAEPMLARAADAVPTGRISLAFLAWAARGQALAPVHDLVAAAVLGEPERAAVHARALAGTGVTSGADFALGLRAALTTLRPSAPVSQATAR
jgi:uncharacterized protein DUF2877